MFVVELAEMVKDYKTGEKSYTNYKAMLFAKSAAAIGYYTQATAEGSFIVLNCEKLKVETFDANSGKTYITLMMDNARLEGAQFVQGAQSAPQMQAPQQHAQQMAPAYQQPAPQQHAPQMQPQMQPPVQQQQAQSWGTPPPVTPQQNNQPEFDDDLPF